MALRSGGGKKEVLMLVCDGDVDFCVAVDEHAEAKLMGKDE